MPGIRIVNGQAVPDEDTEWRGKLMTSPKGIIQPLLANAITALRDSPPWEGVLAWNAFSQRVCAVGKAPIDVGDVWTDQQMRMTCDWLQRQKINVGMQTATDAVLAVAGTKSFHPVKAYLEGLEWDGTPRLSSWLETYLGAAVSDADISLGEYIASAGRCWLISAVARIYHPGCQADNCLILEGLQGSGKSSALKILAGEWFTDHLAALGSKDAAQQLEGVWIVELSELDSMRKSELSATKAFLTCRTDRFRAPYARTVEAHPRQMVFAGTTNDTAYLKDDTGNRRFWPVRCARIDREALARDRDQLWAEALACYLTNEPWWFHRAETVEAAEAQQKERMETDAWDGTIHQWVVSPEQRNDSHGHPVSYMDSNSDWVTTRDVLVHAIGIEEGRITKANQMVAASVLTRLGGNRKKVKVGTRALWVYEFPESSHLR